MRVVHLDLERGWRGGQRQLQLLVVALARRGLAATVIARRGAAAGFGGDPIPQALVITGIVVAFSASALAVALVVRLFEESGSASVASEPPGGDGKAAGG